MNVKGLKWSVVREYKKEKAAGDVEVLTPQNEIISGCRKETCKLQLDETPLRVKMLALSSSPPEQVCNTRGRNRLPADI
jgi:hypothetical protein